MNRKLAILHNDSAYSDNVAAAVSRLSGFADNLVVFTAADATAPANVTVQRLPSECDTEPKMRNWINQKYLDSGFTDFLYVIKDSTEIIGDLAVFAEELECAMRLFGYSAWMSTVTDSCNYVYSKYNPRMTIDIDRPDVVEKTGLSGKIHFTSHSNPQVMVYDFSSDRRDLLSFDTRFTVPMFWIIEFLARRRNSSIGSMFFMNQYLTVGSEVGAFRNSKVKSSKNADSPDAIQKEDAVFKAMNINIAPDNYIDAILEKFWEKIKEKTGISV